MNWTKTAELDWDVAYPYLDAYPLSKQALKSLQEAGWNLVRDDSGDLPNLTFKKEDKKHNLRAQIRNGGIGWYFDSENFLNEVATNDDLVSGSTVVMRLIGEGDPFIAKKLLSAAEG
jgi:hypothetical protein